MKIIIPVSENKIDTKINEILGRAPYLMIRNLENNDIEIIENPGSISPGGAGIKTAQAIIDADIDILLTPKAGENAMEIFNASDIKVYKTEANDIDKNIEDLKNNRLELLE